jgi:4-hydroxyphenylpyruvate dioxygenase
MKVESLGIKRLESVHYYVHDLERSRRFYTDVMDFAEIGESSDELTERGRQKSVAFLAGNCAVICIAPRGEGGRASRWLKKSPDGVGTLNFEVEDVDKAFRLLEGRGGTPIDDVRRVKDAGGNEIAFFSITTPFGDTTFRFIERHGYRALFPGFVAYDKPRGGSNRLGFVGFDHTTSNFATLGHIALWLEHVLGFERFWEIQFHTTDVDPEHETRLGPALARLLGSRLGREVREQRAVAAELPRLADQRVRRGAARPRHPAPRDRGEGHHPVRADAARARPRLHADAGQLLRHAAERLKKLGVGSIDEDIAVLRELEILVDGDGPASTCCRSS